MGIYAPAAPTPHLSTEICVHIYLSGRLITNLSEACDHPDVANGTMRGSYTTTPPFGYVAIKIIPKRDEA